MDRVFLRTHTATLSLALLALLLSFAALKLWVLEPVVTPPVWKGYDSYLFEQEGAASPRQAAQALRRAGYEQVIFRGAQQVAMFTYDGIKDFSLPELRKRYLSQDPLLDPYAASVERYYQGKLDGKPAFIVYAEKIKTEHSAVRSHMRVRKELNALDVAWAKPGSDPLSLILLLGCAGVCIILAAVTIAREQTPLLLAGVLPLAAGVVVPDYTYTAASITLLLGYALFLRTGIPILRMYLNRPGDLRKKTILMPMAIYTVTAAVALCYPVLGAAKRGDSWHIWLGALLQLGIAAMYGLWEVRRYFRQQHSLFYPLRLAARKGRRIPAVSLRSCVPVLLAFALLPVLLQTADGAATVLRLPVPQESMVGFHESDQEEQEITFADLAHAHNTRGSADQHFPDRTGSIANTGREHTAGGTELAETASEELPQGTRHLPTLVDYLSHRAFHEGYLYGREYEFPEPGEKVSIDQYRGEGLEIESVEKTVKMFTDAWYRDIIAEAQRNGIERVLYAQGAPVEVEVNTIKPLRITGKMMKGHVAIAAFLSLFLFMALSWNTHPTYVHRIKTGARDRRKVA